MNSPSPWLVPGIVLGFAIVFPLMWAGVLGLISVIGGWSRLAPRFRCEKPPEGKLRTSVSGCFGLASYRFTLNLMVAQEGLYIAVQSIFSPFHPPLLIPWAQVQDLQPIESGYLHMMSYRSRFRVGSTWVTLTLPVEELQPPAHA